MARFVAWLRAPAGNVIVLADGSGVRGPATVNRYLAGVFGFYDHHARTGLRVAAELVSWRRISRGSYKPFLHHVTKGRPIPVRPVKLHVPQRAPRTLEPEQIVAILAACEHLRDRFLLSLLAETGMRVGQALGLRHCDFVSRKREVHIVPRADNANGARAKVRSAAVVPVSTPLVRLYSEYMHAEYGDIDSDYVFVNLFGGQVGAAMTYPAVHQLIGRIAARTGIGFTAHMLRHSHATDMVRQGVPIEVVARLLTHRSSTTTSQTYVHLGRGRHPGGAVAGQGSGRRRRPVTSPVPAGQDRPRLAGGQRRGGRPRRRVGVGPLGRRPPGHPRPARTRHGALRRDQPALAPRPGQALVPVPPGDRVRVHDHRRRGAGADPVLPLPRRRVTREAGDASAITRPVLEDYLSWLLTQGYSASTRALSLSMIRVFFDACHRHGWLPGPGRQRDHLRRRTPLPPRRDRPVHPRVRDGPARVRRGHLRRSRTPRPATSSWS